MRILLDTNRYGDFCEGDSQSLGVTQKALQVYVPFVVSQVEAGRELKREDATGLAVREHHGQAMDGDILDFSRPQMFALELTRAGEAK
jgi:hypothetical protein